MSLAKGSSYKVERVSKANHTRLLFPFSPKFSASKKKKEKIRTGYGLFLLINSADTSKITKCPKPKIKNKKSGIKNRGLGFKRERRWF